MNPTEEQVERGARAIAIAQGYDPKTLDDVGWYSKQPLWMDKKSTARACLVAALGDGVVVPASPSAEDIYACAKSTLIGFREELTERNIEFICDQISRKATMPLPSAPDCGGVE